ncbi:MAG: aminotransferase class V-fold PLP-dependent enzyme [Pseudomonadota bacterium]
MFYLDYAASSPMFPTVLQILQKSYSEDFANSSAAHSLGRQLHKRIEEARHLLLNLLGGETPGELIFTSSATEANNLLWKGLPLKKGDELWLSSADHPSLTQAASYWAPQGIEVKEIPLEENGHLALEKMTNGRGCLMLSQINNTSGHRHDVCGIAQALKKKNPQIHIHIDAAQSFAKIALSVGPAIDSVSLSAHKMGGPKGIAALYLKKGIELSPLICGGGQEGGLRSSTLPAPLIFAFAAAAAEWQQQGKNFDLVARDCYQTAVHFFKEKIPSAIFPWEGAITGPYILTIILPGVSSDIILRHLEQKEIYLSSSSACSSRVKGKNQVFSALKIPEKWHKNVLRLSWGPPLSKEDLIVALTNLATVYQELLALKA